MDSKLKYIGIIVLLSATSFCQQGSRNVVQAFQSNTIGSTPDFIVMPSNVTSGHILLISSTIDGGSYATVTPSDTLGTTFTLLSKTTDNTLSTTQLECGVLSSSGADTIQLGYTPIPPGASPVGTVVELKNTTCNMDGSPVTNNSHASPATINTSYITSINGVVVFTTLGSAPSGGSWDTNYPAALINVNNETSEILNTITEYNGSGNNDAGTYTTTATNTKCCGGNYQASANMITVALKPSNIKIVTDSINQAASSVAYYYKLLSVGLSGTVTWSLSGGALPSGITLNTSTGVISGTTSSTGIFNPQFTATDGTSTTPSVTLTLQVAPSFGTPTISQHITGCSVCGTGYTLPNPVSCGDIVLLLVHGPDTHFGNGWVLGYNGNNTVVKDNHNNILSPVPIYAGNMQGPLTVYVEQVNFNGTFTLTYTPPSTTSTLSYSLQAITGSQLPLDFATFVNNFVTANPLVLTTTFTSLVPNTLVESATVSAQRNSTNAYSGVFTQLDLIQDINERMSTATYFAAAAGANTSTNTITSVNAIQDPASQFAFGVRPGSLLFAPTCSAFNVRHFATEY